MIVKINLVFRSEDSCESSDSVVKWQLDYVLLLDLYLHVISSKRRFLQGRHASSVRFTYMSVAYVSGAGAYSVFALIEIVHFDDMLWSDQPVSTRPPSTVLPRTAVVIWPCLKLMYVHPTNQIPSPRDDLTRCCDATCHTDNWIHQSINNNTPIYASRFPLGNDLPQNRN